MISMDINRYWRISMVLVMDTVAMDIDRDGDTNRSFCWLVVSDIQYYKTVICFPS